MSISRVYFYRLDKCFNFDTLGFSSFDVTYARWRNQRFEPYTFLQSCLDFFGISGHLLGGTAVEQRYTFNFFLTNSHSCGIHGGITAANDTHVPLSHFLASQIKGLKELH